MIYDFENNTPTLHKDSWVSSNAILIGNVILKKDANVWFNVVLRGDIEPITIGEESNVQDGSVFHTDPGCPLRLGKGVTVGHMVMLHGCEIGDRCLIGINATVMDGAKIGNNSIVAGHAIVAEGSEFPENSIIGGVPAKLLATRDNSESNLSNSKFYESIAARYAGGNDRLDH